MWTAPSSQGVLQCFDQIACVHMSGLLVRSHMNAGQDGFRDMGSKQYCDLSRGPLGLTECPASWIDRSHHLLIILQVWHQLSTVAVQVLPVSGRSLVQRFHRSTPITPLRRSCKKKPSTRLSQEPCLGVKTKENRPSGWLSIQALVSLVQDGALDAPSHPRPIQGRLKARILAYLDDINRDPVIHRWT